MEAHLDSLYGASFRADVGKVGDKQLLSFHLDIPDGRFLPGHPDNLAAGVEFLAAVMQDPHLVDGLFAMDVVNQEKEILRRQIQGLINDKARYATIRLMEQLADGRPFGIRRFGTVEDVDRVANEDLLAWYRHIARHAPLLYFVVGAVDPSSTDHMIREVWPRTVSEDIHPVPLFEPRHHRQLTVDEQEVQQGQLNLGFATRRRLPDPDFPALMMYAGILGGFPHSKLFVNVREKASLAYYAYARVDGAVGLMLIGSGIDVHNFSPAFQIIEEQVEAMTSGAISDQEMAFTLRSFINDLRTEEDAPQSLIGRQMDRILMGGGWSTEDLAPALERVTLQDIIRVASDVELDSVYFLTAKGEGAHARLH